MSECDVFILDADASFDKRKWEEIISTGCRNLPHFTFKDKDGHSEVCWEGEAVCSGVVIVHWSQVDEKLLGALVDGTSDKVCYVVISGNGFDARHCFDNPRAYFRRSAVGKPIDKEFTKCFKRFRDAVANGEPFAASAPLLEPNEVDAIVALYWLFQVLLSSRSCGEVLELQSWKVVFSDLPNWRQVLEAEIAAAGHIGNSGLIVGLADRVLGADARESQTFSEDELKAAIDAIADALGFDREC